MPLKSTFLAFEKLYKLPEFGEGGREFGQCAKENIFSVVFPNCELLEWHLCYLLCRILLAKMGRGIPLNYNSKIVGLLAVGPLSACPALAY